GAVRFVRGLSGGVCRLLRRPLLRGLARGESDGPARRHSACGPRRRVAPRRSLERRGPPLVAFAGPALFGLRLPTGARAATSVVLPYARVRPWRAHTAPLCEKASSPA